MKYKNRRGLVLLLSFFLVFAFLFITTYEIARANPEGASVSYVSNTTKSASTATSRNDTKGTITTVTMTVIQQNIKWKAYVGNVTGSLVLQDADGWSIYDWSITTSLTGEVYATRNSTTITWSSIKCANLTHIANEQTDLNITSSNDNITITFDGQDNDQFDVGTVSISANSCYTTNLYVNGSAPGNDIFEEVLLYDDTAMVYTSIIEQNEDGYNHNATYDFQMIVPEVALASWEGATAYYFYVEIA